jgi:hypothetical protein
MLAASRRGAARVYHLGACFLQGNGAGLRVAGITDPGYNMSCGCDV